MVVNAFKLVEVISNVQLIGEKTVSKIECIECCGKDLYIGTNDGLIIRYSLEETRLPDGAVQYTHKREGQKRLDSRKSVTCLKAASAINRILALCDGAIHLLDMSDLAILSGVIRNVSTFCVNENPNVNNPFCTQICCGIIGKRQLQVYNVTDEQIIHVKDVSIAEPAVGVALDGANICAALGTLYAVYNFVEGTAQRLFSYGSSNLVPVMRRITKDEFLVSAPEGLGMFVTTAGISNRPPIQWSDSLGGLAYAHPYILGLSGSVVMVYSILDQQQKQALPLAGGATIGNFDGRIYLSTASAIYSLIPVPWEDQVEVLLSDMRVEEALDLASNVTRAGMTRERFQQIFQRLQQRAAFVYLARGDFDKAHQLFVSGAVDVCEVIAIFPGLLPPSTGFVRAAPPLHGIADVDQLFRGDDEALKQSYVFLRHFLEDVRQTLAARARAVEVDTALLKLYSESNRQELEALIVAGEIKCDVKDCCAWLETCGCYHALALLHRSVGNNEKALMIWTKILDGSYEDDSFPGLRFFIECLANLNEAELVWRFADFVLEIDEEFGVGIFTLGSSGDKITAIKPDSIIDYLQRFPKAVVRYLEHLVLVQKTPTEKFHTNLAVLYLEDVLKLQKENDADGFVEARLKLRNLLQQSSLYRVQLLLGRMQEAALFEEAAILYGKLEQHEKALDILVRRLKDFEGAEEYCINNSQSDSGQNMFHMLLSTYLDPQSEPQEREEYLLAAIKLLNTRPSEFDAAKVLEIMPPSWPITGVESFLQASLRSSLHKSRMSKMMASLARGETIQQKCALYALERHSIPLHNTHYCCVCKKPFGDVSFARYPNNVLIHPLCIRHNNICPITGRNFQSIGS